MPLGARGTAVWSRTSSRTSSSSLPVLCAPWHTLPLKRACPEGPPRTARRNLSSSSGHNPLSAEKPVPYSIAPTAGGGKERQTVGYRCSFLLVSRIRSGQRNLHRRHPRHRPACTSRPNRFKAAGGISSPPWRRAVPYTAGSTQPPVTRRPAPRPTVYRKSCPAARLGGDPTRPAGVRLGQRSTMPARGGWRTALERTGPPQRPEGKGHPQIPRAAYSTWTPVMAGTSNPQELRDPASAKRTSWRRSYPLESGRCGTEKGDPARHRAPPKC